MSEDKKTTVQKELNEEKPEKDDKRQKVSVDKEKTEQKVAKEKGEESIPTPPPIKRKKGRKVRRQVRRGRVYIKSSYNNTLVLFTDINGGALAWSSAGLLGFKGAKKATTYAANQVLLDADEKVQKYGLKDVEVFVKGVGSGRDAALRALVQKGYNLLSIRDVTPIPHNGCRPKKPRRV